MMRSAKLTVALLALYAGVAGAQPQTCASSTTRTLIVTGAAAVQVPPDRVSFSLGIETEAPTVSQAFKANASKLDALLAALKEKGVLPKDVQTSNLEITSRDDRGKKLPGFRVSNLVTVTREDPKTVGELLQAAIAAGANQASGLRFSVGDPRRLQNRGLELAFQDAKAKAETLAALAKQSLGSVICLSEAASPGTGVFRNRGYASAPADLQFIEAGMEEVSFSVSVVFELK
jgi:uncharacterized protein YggE